MLRSAAALIAWPTARVPSERPKLGATSSVLVGNFCTFLCSNRCHGGNDYCKEILDQNRGGGARFCSDPRLPSLRVPHAALMSQPEYVFARGSARSSVSTLHIDPTYIYFIEDCTLLQVMVSMRANVDLSTQLAQCKTMLDLGRLPGLNFDARFNVIECDDCYRYSPFAPKALKRNHECCGLIKGQRRPRLGRAGSKRVSASRPAVTRNTAPYQS